MSISLKANRNPIYQALVRTRMIQGIRDAFADDPSVLAAQARFNKVYETTTWLVDRGIMSPGEQERIRKLAVRHVHAAALAASRRKTTLVERRRANRQIVKFDREGYRGC